MEFESLLVDTADAVAVVTVNRPDRRNALNATVRRELIDAIDAIGGRDDVRVIVLTGAGEKAFIAGADIAEFAERSVEQQRDAMTGRRAFQAFAECVKPTIAMINGYALGGGCELALACDLRVAARSARLGQPEIKLGLIPGGGGTQRLPRLIGYGRALRMMLTGEMVGAEEAERIGLVDVVVDDADLRAHTLQLAGTIAQHSPVALRLVKAAVRSTLAGQLDAGLANERELFLDAFASEDAREGIAAFFEKRAPRFTGR